MKFYHLIILFSLCMLGCNTEGNRENSKLDVLDVAEINKESSSYYLIQQGPWIGELKLSQTDVLPFNMEVIGDSIFFVNSAERLGALIQEDGEQLVIEMPIFDSEFRFKVKDNGIFGFWHNYAKSETYKIEFLARPIDQVSVNNRFSISESNSFELFDGSWQATFSSDEGEYPAICILNQTKNNVTGTFLTETGDFRYLQGNCIGDSIYLSAFDGAHAFLFKAKQENDTLHGVFYSGSHYKADWIAFRDANFELADQDTLTKLKIGENLEFSFPGLNGEMVQYPSVEYSEKVTIIQVLGSWCPNCVDETIFLADLYDTYEDQDLKIIGISFENPNTLTEKIERVNNLKKHLNANYDFCIGGDASKKLASSVLPSLTGILSFPTTIFIDKFGVVRKIQTGFSGPGTGDYYMEYAKNTKSFISKLLSE